MPTNLYGPGDNFDLNNSHVLPALIRKVHEAKVSGAKEVVLWGTGTPRREFLYVDDCADACLFLMDKYSAAEPINIGAKSDLTIRELADVVKGVIGYTAVVCARHVEAGWHAVEEAGYGAHRGDGVVPAGCSCPRASGGPTYLAEQGHEVHVVCSRQLYQDPKAKLPKTEVVRGVTVHRVWSTRFGRYNILGRIFDSLTFLLAVIVRLIAMTSKRDVVVAKTDPPMLGFCVYLAAVVRRFQLVHWLQDLFPEIAEVSVERRSLRIVLAPVWWVLRGLRNLSLRRARLNVVIGESMGARLRANGVPAEKITVLTNWSPGDQVVPVPKEGNPLIAEWGLEGKFLVVYSGNMGRVHEFITTLMAATSLKADPRIRFVFIGGGPRLSWLINETARRNLDNVVFRPYQPLNASATASEALMFILPPSNQRWMGLSSQQDLRHTSLRSTDDIRRAHSQRNISPIIGLRGRHTRYANQPRTPCHRNSTLRRYPRCLRLRRELCARSVRSPAHHRQVPRALAACTSPLSEQGNQHNVGPLRTDPHPMLSKQRIVSWQPVLTDHQAHTLGALGRRCGHPVTSYAIRLEDAHRKAQGWTATQAAGVDQRLLPSHKRVRHIIATLKSHRADIHLFCSPFEHPHLMMGLAAAATMGLTVFLIAEPYSPNWRRILRQLSNPLAKSKALPAPHYIPHLLPLSPPANRRHFCN
jgi:hypothetical protein